MRRISEDEVRSISVEYGWQIEALRAATSVDVIGMLDDLVQAAEALQTYWRDVLPSYQEHGVRVAVPVRLARVTDRIIDERASIAEVGVWEAQVDEWLAAFEDACDRWEEATLNAIWDEEAAALDAADDD